MQVLQQEVPNVLDADGNPAQLWVAKPETANRLRGRVERILSWAKVNGYRTGEHPAVWREHLTTSRSGGYKTEIVFNS